MATYEIQTTHGKAFQVKAEDILIAEGHVRLRTGDTFVFYAPFEHVISITDVSALVEKPKQAFAVTR